MNDATVLGLLLIAMSLMAIVLMFTCLYKDKKIKFLENVYAISIKDNIKLQKEVEKNWAKEISEKE